MIALPYDFYHLWASARVARLGGNPYVPEQITPLMLESGWPPSEVVSGFMHPFWSLAILTPLSYLPFPLAALVWELSIVLLVILSVRFFLNNAVRNEVGEPPTLPSVFLTTALFPPLLSTLTFGQTSAVLLFGCAGWLSFFCQKRFFASGMLLSLTTLKPQLFIPLYVWVFFHQLRNQEWRSLLGFSTGLLLQMTLAALLAPQTPSQWVAAMSSLSQTTSELPTPAFARLVATSIGFLSVSSIALLVAALTGGILALVCRGRVAERATLFIIPLGLLTTSYVWSHSFLVLLLPYLMCVRRVELQRESFVPLLSLALALWGILEICYVGSLAPYSVILPITLLLCGARSVFARPRVIG